MIVRVSFLTLPLAVIASGCLGGSDDGGANSAFVAAGALLIDLEPPEFQAACDEVSAQLERVRQEPVALRGVCLVAAASVGSLAEPGEELAECEAAIPQCPASVSNDDEPPTLDVCRAGPAESCNATVLDLRACVAEEVRILRKLGQMGTCSAALSGDTSWWQDVPAACQEVELRCPRPDSDAP